MGTIIRGRIPNLLAITVLAASAIASVATAQNTLQFVSVQATTERAILLHWASNPNEVYEIDYADQLAGKPDGSTAWSPLYTEYPSHGTNTFVADCGNYDMAPPIPHPSNAPMRFYRIVYSGTNTSPTNPTVAITSPVTGAVLSGDVVVNVNSASPEFLTEVTLYVDGEPQWMSNDGTNFPINTCEWPNGPHTLFATAKSESAIEGVPYNYTVTYGRSVSPYVNVTFNNLIANLDLSQYFFEPSEAQTQHISATFASDVNWTLEIQNSSTNDVLYVTGSGASMQYDWAGTGTNGATLPDGAYSYLLSAQTNGQSLVVQPPPPAGSPPPAPDASGLSLEASASTETTLMSLQEAINAGLAVWHLKPPPMPPVEQDGVWVPWEDVYGPQPLLEVDLSSFSLAAPTDQQSGSASQNDSSPSSQSTRAPKRKPLVGVRNKAGTFGVCYQSYPAGAYMQEPPTGLEWPLQPIFTGLNGAAPISSYIPWSTLTTTKDEVKGFSQGMQLGQFKPQFILADGYWSANDIKSFALGGNSIFSACNFGLLSTHGCYGTYPEIDGIYYTYLALYDMTNGAAYVRLSDMTFGSFPPNGMKWMTIDSCSMLNASSVTSMANNSKLPMNGNLHLLLGFNSLSYSSPWWGLLYSSNLVMGVNIPDAFVASCTAAYKRAYQANAAGMTNAITCRIMGDQTCVGDSLYLFNDPDPNSPFEIIDRPVNFRQ